MELGALGVGDPVYILGDCVPREVDHIEQWGGHETLPQALLTMVPTVGTGDASIVHYGTEIMSWLATDRSLRFSSSRCSSSCLASSLFISYTP